MSSVPRDDPPPRPLRNLSILLATLGGNLYLLVGTIVLASLGVIVSIIPPRGCLTFWVAKVWSWGLLAAGGVRVQAHFSGPMDRSLVFLANHQSTYDIPLLIATVPVQARFAAKRELFRIPIFGWALWAGGFIPIDRERRGRAKDAFSAGEKRLAEGTSVIFFPEGTRSSDGRLLPLRRGGFVLAMSAGAPIVPVGIRRTRDVQQKKRLWIHPGTVEIHYGTPIETQDRTLDDLPDLVEEVRLKILELSQVESAGGNRPRPRRRLADDPGQPSGKETVGA